MARLTASDGGSHPPEMTAIIMAEEIAPFDFQTETRRGQGVAAQKLQTALAEALTPLVAAAQRDALAHLSKDADAHFAADHGEPMVGTYCDQGLEAVRLVAKGTPWAAHFADPVREPAIRQVLGTHFVTAQHVERLWHHVRNPGHAGATAYYVRFHGKSYHQRG